MTDTKDYVLLRHREPSTGTRANRASFEATVRHAKGSAREIRSHAPKDQALHGIADSLKGAQRQNVNQLSADVTHLERSLLISTQD